MSKHIDKVKEYFAAQNAADGERVVKLFTEDAQVHNANLPPVKGRDGVKSFCEDLYARTSSRSFQLLEAVREGDVVMAEWQVEMSFRPGAKVGPFELARGFEVRLRGINKFSFEPAKGLVCELRVYHETSSVARLAQENSKPR